jgi:hypothetical protein
MSFLLLITSAIVSVVVGLGERVLTGDSPTSWYPFQVLATTSLILELPLRILKTTIQDLIKVITLFRWNNNTF